MPGPYKIGAIAISGRIAATNKVANAPYRGAGRPEAAFAMERSIDLVATELGLEPAEVRLRNMIPAAEMPYAVGMPYRDGQPIVLDGGDYPGALQKALAALGGVDAFRVRQRAALQAGRYLGLGIGCYVEGTGVGPFESALVRIDPSGKIFVTSGACPQGQGMETIFSQIVADAWQVTPDDVVISLADTAAIAIGFGTIASRSTVTLSAAIHGATEKLRDKVFSIAANMLECAATDLELRRGHVGIVGVPGAEVSLAKVALAARPGWDSGRPAGVDGGLEETYYFEPPTVTWSYAAHAAVVEVDIELGRVKVENYAIAHDCGVVVNPMLVEGQIVGGAVQGLGGALLEEIKYDAEGQPLTTTLADYMLPTACDLPPITIIHQHSPSPLNPFGVKGVGEGGPIAPPVVIANAVCDALRPFKAEFNRTPVTPQHDRRGGARAHERADRFNSTAAHGRFPCRQLFLAHAGVHLRREPALQLPVLGKAVRLGKKSGVQAGEIGGAERRGFPDLRPVDGAADEIGEALHGEIGIRHAAVDAQDFQRARAIAPIRAHRVEQIDGLKANTLQRRLRQFARPGGAGEPEQRAARLGPPIGRAQADEGRHQHDLLGRIGGLGERAGLLGALHDVQTVAQPLHRRAGDEDRAFERV